MRMNQNERRFDFHGLGLALKRGFDGLGEGPMDNPYDDERF